MEGIDLQAVIREAIRQYNESTPWTPEQYTAELAAEVAVRQRLERELVEMEKNLTLAEEKERALRAHAVTIRQAAENLVRVASQVERGLVIP